jgi:hypothetical protein
MAADEEARLTQPRQAPVVMPDPGVRLLDEPGAYCMM